MQNAILEKLSFFQEDQLANHQNPEAGAEGGGAGVGGEVVNFSARTHTKGGSCYLKSFLVFVTLSLI